MRLVAVALAALVLAPAAGAWTTLSGGVQNIVVPSMLAVDSTGLVQVAFYSNADPDGTFLYERLAGDLSVAGSTALKPTAPHDDRVPLVADRSGATFMAWPPGYPTATRLTVVTFKGGQPAGDGVSFAGKYTGGDRHAALRVDAQDRLWAVWTVGSVVRVARSGSHVAHFGAVVTSTPSGGTQYQASAVGLPGNPGAIDVIVNTGSALVEEQLKPGLSVRVTKTSKKVGEKTVVTYFAQALDDGFGVPTATFHVGARTFKADASGKAKVPRGKGTAAAAGYAGTRFKVP